MQSPRWGVVQLVGHLTVNEDGEGSNPSAPANSLLENLIQAMQPFSTRDASPFVDTASS
jgi:hypothetical protein